MIDPERLVCAHSFDGDGRASARIQSANISATPPEAGFDWIHLDAGDGDVTSSLAYLGLDPIVAEALSAPDTRPRCSVFGDAAIVNLRGVNLNPDNAPEDMVSIRFWVTGNRVISVRRRRLMAVTDLEHALQRGYLLKTPAALLASLSLRLIDRMQPTIAQLNEQVDELEDSLDAGTRTEGLSAISDIRREATLLRRYLAPQRDALSSIVLEDFPWQSRDDRNRLREAADQTARLTEDLEAIRERAAILRDQAAELRADAMNQHTLILSIAAAIFLPLGLVAGMLGMNVGGMPGADNVHAFWIVSLGLTLGGIGLTWVFKRAGWF